MFKTITYFSYKSIDQCVWFYNFIFSCWKQFYYKLNKLNVNYADESIESMIYDGLDDLKKGILKFKFHASSRLVFYKNDKSDTEYLYPILSQLLVIIIHYFMLLLVMI